MTSSDPIRPELVPHPLRVRAQNLPTDCEITASFRTFDPVDRVFAPLADVRVDLVRSSDGFRFHGATDGNGDLYFTTPGTKLTVPDVHLLGEDVDFHFEINGPAAPAPASADLTYLCYPMGVLQPESFPISAWVTRGWREPEGQWGHFRLASNRFPALPERRFFTVGCYMHAQLKFLRGTDCIAPYPENAVLSVVGNGPDARVHIAPGGDAGAIFFPLVPGKPIGIQATLSATSILGDKISEVTGNLKIGTDSIVTKIAGEKFAIPGILAANSIELYNEHNFTINALPPISPILPDETLQYQAYFQKKDSYAVLSSEEKCAVVYNWFLEFVACRNLFSRTMNYLLACIPSPTWSGLQPHTLIMSDAEEGLASAFGSSTINAFLQYILNPLEGTCFHEMTHNLANSYFNNVNMHLHFPLDTNKHYTNSYSNEMFAFAEGFADFIATLFVDPRKVYSKFALRLRCAWRHCLIYQAGSPLDAYPVVLGFSDEPIIELEPSGGLALELAFSVGMATLWTDHIWPTRSPALGTDLPWVVDRWGDGTLGTDIAASANHWLLDSSIQNGFSDLFALIRQSPKVLSRISTRRILDLLEARYTGNAMLLGSWADLKIINKFYVTWIQVDNGSGHMLARSNATSPPEFRTIGSSPQPGTPTVFVDSWAEFTRGSTTTVTIRGIRFPPDFTGEVRQTGTAPLIATIDFTALGGEYEATGTFNSTGLSTAVAYDVKLITGTATQLLVNVIKATA